MMSVFMFYFQMYYTCTMVNSFANLFTLSIFLYTWLWFMGTTSYRIGIKVWYIVIYLLKYLWLWVQLVTVLA